MRKSPKVGLRWSPSEPLSEKHKNMRSYTGLYPVTDAYEVDQKPFQLPYLFKLSRSDCENHLDSFDLLPTMKLNRKLRMGMIGGGRGAFIGAVHRMAARLDGEIDLVAGFFSDAPAESSS